jgi:hypothetical protein
MASASSSTAASRTPNGRVEAVAVDQPLFAADDGDSVSVYG